MKPIKEVVVVTFLLHTKQPILVTSLQGDPNSDVSFSYIPGSTIRGMLISRYIKRYNLTNEDDILDNPDIRTLFFNGNTRYLNAYLYSKQKQKRSLPVPQSWFKRKHDDLSDTPDIQVYDFSYERPNQDTSYKSLEQDFCIIDDESALLYQPKRRINIHNMRNRQKGRGTDDDGAVFRYEALDAGQTFQAVIICDRQNDTEQTKTLNRQNDIEQIKTLLSPINTWLGGSQSAGYGQVEIDSIEEVKDWVEVGIPPENREDENPEFLRITLLSDLILRDERGHYVVTPVTESGSNEILQLASPLTKILEEYLDMTLQPKASFVGSSIVGGFNRKWGLPLPQTPALTAGSVFIFKYEGKLDPQKVSNLENQGVGERRVDGFGRIAINWLKETPYFDATLESPSIVAESQQQPSLTFQASQIATKMTRRLLEKKLDGMLLEKINKTHLDPKKLTNSQLSRLIIAAKKSITEQNENSVIQLLDNLTRQTTIQFEETRINGRISFKKWICEMLNNQNDWINENDIAISIARQPFPSDVVKKLKLEYALRLIIAVSKQAMKD